MSADNNKSMKNYSACKLSKLCMLGSFSCFCCHLLTKLRDKAHLDSLIVKGYIYPFLCTTSTHVWYWAYELGMSGFRKISQRGSNWTLTVLFSSWGGKRGVHQIPLKAGHHRSASETPFKWRFSGGPILAQHWMVALWFFRWSEPALLKKPYIFVIFQGRGGGVPDPLSPVWIRTCWAHWFCNIMHYVKNMHIV